MRLRAFKKFAPFDRDVKHRRRDRSLRLSIGEAIAGPGEAHATSSGIEQSGNEYVLDLELPFGQALFMMIAKDCIEGRAVGSDTVRPPVGSQQVAIVPQ